MECQRRDPWSVVAATNQGSFSCSVNIIHNTRTFVNSFLKNILSFFIRDTLFVRF